MCRLDLQEMTKAMSHGYRSSSSCSDRSSMGNPAAPAAEGQDGTEL